MADGAYNRAAQIFRGLAGLACPLAALASWNEGARLWLTLPMMLCAVMVVPVVLRNRADAGLDQPTSLGLDR